MKGNRKLQAGFTSVEALIAVALVAIILLISIPALTRMLQTYRIRTAASQIATHLRMARYNSIKQKIDYRIVVVDDSATTDKNIYSVQYRPAASFETLPGYRFKLPPGVKVLADSLDQIDFTPRGRCLTSPSIANGQIHLQNNQSNHQYRISIGPAGAVQVENVE